eukprot:SAG31_NODE_8102_length_1523_cov_1.759831_1_plen_273_part_00
MAPDRAPPPPARRSRPYRARAALTAVPPRRTKPMVTRCAGEGTVISPGGGAGVARRRAALNWDRKDRKPSAASAPPARCLAGAPRDVWLKLMVVLVLVGVAVGWGGPRGDPCNVRPGVMPRGCANYSIGVFDMSRFSHCCSQRLPAPSYPNFGFGESPCQWRTPVILGVPNVSIPPNPRKNTPSRTATVLLMLAEARLGAQVGALNGCSNGEATSIWQRPSTDGGYDVNHHSQIFNGSHIVLGSAVYVPARKRALLFFTSGSIKQPNAILKS